MDLATILGLVIGTALVLASMFIEASAGGNINVKVLEYI